MARFRKSLALRPLPRREVVEYLALLFDVAESLTPDPGAPVEGTLTAEDGRAVPHVRLRSGAHLRPGAVYDLSELEPGPGDRGGPAAAAQGSGRDGEPGAPETEAASALDPVAELTLLAWNRGGDTGARLTISEERMRVTTEGWLRGSGRPKRLECSGRVAPDPGLSWSRLRRLTWSGWLNLDRWYAAAGARARPGRGRVALAGRLAHRWARGSFQVAPRAGVDGRWRVVVRLEVRGRGALRPLAAVGLLLARSRIERGLEDWLREAARRWERWAGQAAVGDREALRRRIVEELCAPEPGSGADAGSGTATATGSGG